MKPPCEIVSKYLLPAVRAQIAKILIEKYGYTQMTAASKLGMTQSAMSRYLTLERGTKIVLGKEIFNFVEEVAHNIDVNHFSEEETLQRFCFICKTIREQGTLCDVHKERVTSKSGDCKACIPTDKKKKNNIERL